jgi:hypothetical protein
MHLALQTLLQHGRFVQLEVLAACASLSVASSAQHHVLGLQAAHLFVSTLTALLLCSCCCVSESCAVVEARCASASFLA